MTLSAVSSCAQVYKCRNHQTHCYQLRREQDNCPKQPHAISSQVFNQVIASLSATMQIIMQLALRSFICPSIVERIPRVGICFIIVLAIIIIIVIILGFCFFTAGWSRVGESGTSTWEAASLSATGTSTAKVEAGTSGEATSTSWEASGLEATASKATLVAHHTEQDLRVDATHAPSHTATEHVSRVYEIIAIIVAGSLLRIAERLIGFLHVFELGLCLGITRVLVRV